VLWTGVGQVRGRSTFLKVGQSLILRRRLQTEKKLKHNMIHSLMPPKVAEQVLRSRENEQRSSDDRSGAAANQQPGTVDMFRRFHMLQVASQPRRDRYCTVSTTPGNLLMLLENYIISSVDGTVLSAGQSSSSRANL